MTIRGSIEPLTLYRTIGFCSSLFMSLIFTVNVVYHVTVVQLTPLQLVLVGTILETAVFLFEIPTGVLADVKSRRLSVIIGYAIMGTGFIIEGSFPAFWAIALAQIVWGLGYTFTSGATQAWVVDEMGEEHVGQAFIRGSQAAKLGGLLAIPAGIALGSAAVILPILLGGALLVLLAVFLALTMTEEGFRPTPPDDRTTAAMMVKTLRDARLAVSRQPVLLTLLGVGLFYGLYSEGLDRLWIPHLLDNFGVPWLEIVGPVVWFGGINGVGLIIGLLASEVARRRLVDQGATRVGRALTGATIVIIVALAGFGLARSFGLALGLLWLVGALRAVHSPLHETWINQRIDDPQVRATLLSVSSQMDAIGQIAGGPAVGFIGNRSIRAALVTSAALLSPAVPLYVAARKRISDRSKG